MGHSEHYEYRLKNRILLSAFFFSHASEIVAGRERMAISLVNVNHVGARLRKQPGVDYEDLNEGLPVVLNLRLGEADTENLEGTVAWTNGEDVYVDFGSRLSVGASYLQGLAEN